MPDDSQLTVPGERSVVTSKIPLGVVRDRGSWVLSGLFIGLCVSLNLYYLTQNLIGDLPSGPLAYFFTWDMFPGYGCVSQRRMALGKTHSGEFVKLYPTFGQQFRRGVQRLPVLPAAIDPDDLGGYSRADLDRSGLRFRQLVDHELLQAEPQLQNDPVEHVYLLETYWAKRLNLPDDLYLSWSGSPKPEGRYWRVVDDYTASQTTGQR